MRLDPAAVMAAATDWVYVPDGAPEVRTAEFHVVAYPLTWSDPTAAWSIVSDRPADEVIDDVLRAAADLGRHEVVVWTHTATRPADLAEHLLDRGAELHEELAVLARPLDDLPDLALPTDVEVRAALDLDTLRDADRVGVEVFGGALSSDEELVRGPIGDLAQGIAHVAYRDGRPVASAGCTVRAGTARLWGGAVLPDARGTGAYRVLLDHRLRLAVQQGCTIALVKGRLDTSAPILRRAGFEQYGEERGYRLVLG